MASPSSQGGEGRGQEAARDTVNGVRSGGLKGAANGALTVDRNETDIEPPARGALTVGRNETDIEPPAGAALTVGRRKSGLKY